MRSVGTGVVSNVIDEFLGSTHVFSLALTDVVESALLRSAADGRLTPAQMKVLKLVSQANGQTISAVATFLGVSTAAASKAVDRLVRRGFLSRGEGRDRRSCELSPTPAGQRALQEFEAARMHRLSGVFARLSPEELRSAARTLDRLAAGMVSTSGSPAEVCVQCGVYFAERCLLHEAVQRRCHYRKKRARTAENAPQQGGKFE